MIKVDCHAHSEYSRHPSEWFLQRLGTQESYTTIDKVYELAKRRGMDLVTITDHNCVEGALRLREKHPEDVFVSNEITTYFPENGCKVHVLAYDLDEKSFAEIEKRRDNIYVLRDFLKEADIACSVAHATYSVNERLDLASLEKLILLFDVFEAINGSRGIRYNQTLTELLRNLTPEHIERLVAKHGLKPWSDTPWIKGLTGGSDDHAGLTIGDTYTISKARTLPEFIAELKERDTHAGGNSGDHKSLAFAIYKIAYQFSKGNGGIQGAGLMDFINNMVFKEKESRPGIKDWFTLRRLKKPKDSQGKLLARFVEGVEKMREAGEPDSVQQFELLYNNIGELADGFFTMILESVENNLRAGNPGKLLKNLSAALPAGFMVMPFFTTMLHLDKDRGLLAELVKEFGGGDEPGEKSALWFSDTITDLNGVAVTMRNIAWRAFRDGRKLKVVTCLPEDEFAAASLPPNVINLPCIYHHTPDFYTSFTLRVPSPLRSLELIHAENPDEIIISTPGPVGGIGALVGAIKGIKRVGVYHTDFTKQADLFIGDPWVSGLIEWYVNWFHKALEEVRVPTRQYIEILTERGYDPARMKLFERNIGPEFIRDNPGRVEKLRKNLGIDDGATLLYAGRLGKEKNLDFLIEIYRELRGNRERLNLLMVGDGPELERLRRECAADKRIVFAGRVDRAELCYYYQASDVFVFPSTTDTFGMVVLEAQACGLPTVVSNVGGPQDIVKDGSTGRVVPDGDLEAWAWAVGGFVDMALDNPDEFAAFRSDIRGQFASRVGWEAILDDMLGARTRRFQPPAPAIDAAPALAGNGAPLAATGS